MIFVIFFFCFLYSGKHFFALLTSLIDVPDHFNVQSFLFLREKPNKLDFFRRHTLVKIVCKRSSSSSSSSSCAVISDCRCQTIPARRVRIQLHLISGTRWLGYSEKLGHLKFGPKAKSLDKVGKVGLEFCQELNKPLNN